MSAQRFQDHYGRRAKREGYPARSVFKLEEIDRRAKILRSGLHVLDLGAYPGSWTLYASQRVGPRGFVLAVDQHQLEDVPSNARALTGDIFAFSPDDFLSRGPFDVVISDMAPATSGQRHRDQFLSFQLVERALQLATQVLKPGGTFIAKIFQGAELDQARALVRQHFAEHRLMRPSATRRESYELFLIAQKLRSNAP